MTLQLWIFSALLLVNKLKLVIVAWKTGTVTTPLYYPNGTPHLGHLYTSTAADVIKRFYNDIGNQKSFLLTQPINIVGGVDEHGEAMAATNTSTKYVQNFKSFQKDWNVTADCWVRTSSSSHTNAVQTFYKRLYSRNALEMGEYIHDSKNSTEPTIYFPIRPWFKKLLAFYTKQVHVLQPKSRAHETLKLIKSGNWGRVAITRHQHFHPGIKGIPVPDNPNLIFYVWFDALIGYLSGVGYPHDVQWNKKWPPDLQIIGKDILKFHAIFLPAMLLAAGLPLPKKIFAHGWWTCGGTKISKSLGNGIEISSLLSNYGADVTRFFILNHVKFGADAEFNMKELNFFKTKLSNEIGNLVHRVLSLVASKCNGDVPYVTTFSQNEDLLLGSMKSMLPKALKYMDNLAFSKYTQMILNLAHQANRYIDQQAPWQMDSVQSNEFKTTIFWLCEAIWRLAILCQPIMPNISKKIFRQFGYNSAPSLNELQKNITLPAELKIQKPLIIFT